MKYELIPERKEYGIEILNNPLLASFFYHFQKDFQEYAAQSLQIGRALASLLPDTVIKNELEQLLADKNKKEFPDFNRYVGDLERACHAAQTLRGEYDIGVGIAKKGSWLSYVFNLHNFPTGEVYILRTSDETRFMHPLSILQTKDIKDKRILLFDNDLVTGHSVKTVTDKFHARGAQSIDLLLVYKHTRQKKENYDWVKRTMKYKPVIVGETAAEFVIDPTQEIPALIRKTMSLECDFDPARTYLDNLMKKLGVSE
ncbi:MAG: phosphoribosyltransferase family protein [Nanoarchaeota archaeon]